MYTSASKPLSVFLVHHIEAALLSPTFGCAVDVSHVRNSTGKCTKYCSMNRHSWLVFISVTYEKMTQQWKTKTPPINNKSVATANVEHLSDDEKRFGAVPNHT